LSHARSWLVGRAAGPTSSRFVWARSHGRKTFVHGMKWALVMSIHHRWGFKVTEALALRTSTRIVDTWSVAPFFELRAHKDALSRLL
jgi:hypothetical protein